MRLHFNLCGLYISTMYLCFPFIGWCFVCYAKKNSHASPSQMSSFVKSAAALLAGQKRAIMVILILSLLCMTRVWPHHTCESYDFANPFHGRYCPTEGIIIPNLLWHECKLFCIQTFNCQSVNYNFTDYSCTYFTATCSKAISHQGMAFVLSTRRQSAECIEWIPKENDHPKGDDRSVTEDNKRFTVRMQKNGNDILGYQLHETCYARDVDGELYRSSQGFPCQYLRIRDDCTVYYMTYELGTPLPPNALIGGYTARGLPVYIGIVDGGKAPKSYIPGSNRWGLIGQTATQNVKLLVLL